VGVEIQTLASGSSGNCYKITDGITPLLIDPGIPWKKIQPLLNFRTSEIAGALLGHEHGDHSKAVQDVMNAGINVHLSSGTLDALGLEGHRLHRIKAGEQFRVGTWAIKPIPAQHDAIEPLCFLMQSTATGEKLLYASDTYYLENRFNGLNFIMVECNFAMDILQANVASGAVPVEMKNRLLQSHFSLENVKKFLRANDLSKVRQIHLIHLSNGNSDAVRFKREIMALTGKVVIVA